MCGIVGVIGNNNTTDILLNGLEKLEYRGYDSAGIYVNNQAGKDFLVKEVGKISELENAVTSDVQGLAGIGHTRWATHGKPTIENAHPHFSEDNRFYLVHNGVITNYTELKKEYLSDFKFESQTDTEVAVQLIDYFAKKGMDGEAAFRKALSLIEGSYAFAMIDKEEPDRIFVAKNKSPLLIGLGDGFNVICSDAMAMLDQTHKFVEIHDGEVVILKKDAVEISKIDGTKVQRDPYTVNIDENDISKGTYDHYMLKEIDEQPNVMRKISKNYINDDGSLNVEQDLLDEIKQADRLYIVAAGTSYHAGLVGRNIFEKVADVPVDVELGSEFGYHMPKLSKKPFFIFLSQSGETADSRQVLVKVNEMKFPSLTMTNVANSTLSREATYTMELLAGPEIAVASTKAYTAQIAVEAVLAKALGEAKDLQIAKEFNLKEQLALAANGIQTIVDEKDKIKELTADYLTNKSDAFYIGRGVDYALSLEAALKLKEISYIHAEGFAAGELKHGTIALIEKDTPVFAYVNDGIGASHTRGNIQEVEARGAHVLVIASQKYSEAGDQIIIPEIDELISPIISIVPAQLIAYYASLARGNDVDKPRNLAKSVTVE
ncbi:glucosamine--fructose-6-phosphate aminotransferase [Companilactobacillus paralimentarius DSM 13238 = JCM 10415]|uniref:Glutamine--fructose-6-phosphate aminotransferase [isomerizing] n=1 Tax=Companilactobacillus paralimentarius DSM 13238 = JCM 10415 TaxID=1122151 RepID=A0A0R1P9X8_9LACO|nr:glutamine--fructose-6-phosphate transaminase (isomerizing) [Companilactobacillus paralimentarius]KAE9565462.1 glutamine--fructose-6-phosphate aminotransferase [Companilactobacillus paralimentarius]KRL29293.1 glucosamine--fructose-6-phosphate aminotransferase [Companilactobacillus paralimentarius DSM 13238 = JCM 10415]MDR4933461.1 glutamine--fructose-6-phosphate transaminase (isomerizing) [Companilactobacillus paralimentarius]QFR69944.1 glutamine--fructose-6-phosphate transaminase (isomerizin